MYAEGTLQLLQQELPCNADTAEYPSVHLQLLQLAIATGIPCDMRLLVIPCLLMQYEKILMVWVRITRG